MATNYASIERDGTVFECRVIPVFRRKPVAGYRLAETDEINYLILSRTTDLRTGISSEWDGQGATYATAGDARAHLPRADR